MRQDAAGWPRRKNGHPSSQKMKIAPNRTPEALALINGIPRKLNHING
jgi:hypothetical protein